MQNSNELKSLKESLTEIYSKEIRFWKWDWSTFKFELSSPCSNSIV